MNQKDALSHLRITLVSFVDLILLSALAGHQAETSLSKRGMPEVILGRSGLPPLFDPQRIQFYN